MSWNRPQVWGEWSDCVKEVTNFHADSPRTGTKTEAQVLSWGWGPRRVFPTVKDWVKLMEEMDDFFFSLHFFKSIGVFFLLSGMTLNVMCSGGDRQSLIFVRSSESMTIIPFKKWQIISLLPTFVSLSWWLFICHSTFFFLFFAH